MPINPGRLRHRIVVQDYTTSRDAYGGETKAWQTFATVWASIETLSGTEREHAMKIVATATHQVRIRFLDGITTAMRFTHDGRTFNIGHIGNDRELDELMTLIVTERQ